MIQKMSTFSPEVGSTGGRGGVLPVVYGATHHVFQSLMYFSGLEDELTFCGAILRRAILLSMVCHPTVCPHPPFDQPVEDHSRFTIDYSRNLGFCRCLWPAFWAF